MAQHRHGTASPCHSIAMPQHHRAGTDSSTPLFPRSTTCPAHHVGPHAHTRITTPRAISTELWNPAAALTCPEGRDRLPPLTRNKTGILLAEQQQGTC